MKSLGVRQQPCGVPVLTVSLADTRPPNFITCGLLVRKSRIQLQVGVGIPRPPSFVMSAWAYCVKDRAVVQKEHPGIRFTALQVMQGVVEG